MFDLRGTHSLLECEETSSNFPSNFFSLRFLFFKSDVFFFLPFCCKFVCSEENNQSDLRAFLLLFFFVWIFNALVSRTDRKSVV